LFQQNLYKDANAFLGIAVRLAQNMGLHRDPINYPFSSGVCEIRHRLWNHLCCLDGWALASFGAESCLPATSDSRPPINADDIHWHPSRFAKPADAPIDMPEIKDLTFALVNREISDTIRKLALINTDNFEEREDVLRQAEISLTTRYLSNIDRSNPTHTVVVAFIEICFSSLRLSVRYRKAKCSKVVRCVTNREQ
jgi:hypothetical protein